MMPGDEQQLRDDVVITYDELLRAIDAYGDELDADDDTRRL
jgi:hypothetical protein